ncbi:MAG: glycosyltransferase [Halioglobus sp.]
MVKYLDRDKFRIFVITRKPVSTESLVKLDRVFEVEVEGEVFSRSSGYRYLMYVLLASYWRKFPFRFGRYIRNSWALNATNVCDGLIRAEKSEGRTCVVIGTFCPLDALAAASSVAYRHDIPLIQDFRDGLGFEPIGAQSRAAIWAKAALEKRLCLNAVCLTAVTVPIVDYLKQRYISDRVRYLPNGYDPSDFDKPDSYFGRVSSKYFGRAAFSGKFVIGHFGQISVSDPTSLETLRRFARCLENMDEIVQSKIHFVFMGKLTPVEITILSELKVSVSVLKSRSRIAAIELMRRVDGLLLLTGSRSSVATGKIYDYLALSKKIIHVSRVHNEAQRIIAGRIGVYHYLLDDLADAEVPKIDWRNIVDGSMPETPAPLEYSKVVLARNLESMVIGLLENGVV